ncbi:protein AMN1 homolog [Festucalex cinctus]
MNLTWQNGQLQKLGPSSQPQAQIANKTMNPGVRPQHGAVSCDGGPSNKPTGLSHQTVGGNHTGDQRPFVNLQNLSCNMQGKGLSHVNGPQNAVHHSSVQHRSDLMPRTMFHQQGTSLYIYSQPQPILPVLQHRMNNVGLYQVYNQVSSNPNLVITADPPQVRQKLPKTGGESSYANNMHMASVNTTQHVLYPSGLYNMNTFTLIPISTGQNLQVSSLNQPTKQSSSTMITPPAAETRHDVIGPPSQGSTYQQTTTQQSGQLAMRELHFLKKHPRLKKLLLGPKSVSVSAQSLSPNKQNENSISAKVIAVVQPLSPQCNINTTTSKSPTTHNINFATVDRQNKTTKECYRNPLESEIQQQSKNSQSMDTSATGQTDDVLSKGSSAHASATEHADDMPSKIDSVGSHASQPVTLESQNDKEAHNTDEMPPSAKDETVKLSSLPTTTWTLKELTSLAAEIQSAPTNDKFRKQLIVMFWGASLENLSRHIKQHYFHTLAHRANLFCDNNVKEDTVVLSQVETSFADQLNNFHVLQDGEVYTEQPYTSSWLNKNKQLDDIDKEFGPNIYSYVDDNQPDPVKRDGISSPTVRKIPTPDAETVDKSCNDPLFFEIQVLSPEKAKAVFEQGHVVMSQSTASINRPEEVANARDTVVDEPPQDVHVTSGSKIVDSIDHFCCIAKWKEIIFGSKTTSHDKCQCKEEVCDLAKKQEQMDCPHFTIEPDVLSHSPEGDMESKSGENITSSLPTVSWLEICDKISETFELNGEETHDMHGQQPKRSQETNKENVSSCDNITNRIADNDEDVDEAQLKPAEGCLTSDSHTSDSDSWTDNEIETPASRFSQHVGEAQLKPAESCPTSDSHTSDSDSWTNNEIETPVSRFSEHVEQARTASSHVTKPSLGSQQIKFSAMSESQTDVKTIERKRKRLSNPNSIFPYLKKLMNKPLDSHEVSKSESVVGSDGDPSVSDGTVQLMLFGSLPQENQALMSHRNETTKPPKVIFAKVDSKKKNSLSCGSNSFGSDTKSALSQMKIKLGTKMGLIMGKRKKFHSSGDKDLVGQQHQSIQHDRTNDNGTKADLPIQENVLKFSVLPTSFSFEAESSGPKETMEHSSDEPSSDSEGKRPNMKSRVDLRSHFPIKESSSLQQHRVSKSSGVFAEYQKKYMQKSQSSSIH